MQTATKIIRERKQANRIITADQLKRLLGNGDGRRYALVNRALKSGELVRIQRGLYTLAQSDVHPFVVSQAITPGSYVSFETALAYWGWIPEKVSTITSVTPGRKAKLVENERFGLFRFLSLAINRGYFLELINRIEIEGGTALIAQPGRALMDLVCRRKIAWTGLDWLTHGLRIDYELLQTISREKINLLRLVYKHKRMQTFIDALGRELYSD